MRATPVTSWKKVIVTQRDMIERFHCSKAELKAYLVAQGLDPDKVMVMEEVRTGALVFAQRDYERKLGA